MKVKYKNTVIPCPMQELGKWSWHVGKNLVAQTFYRKNSFTWTWTLKILVILVESLLSHLTVKYSQH